MFWMSSSQIMSFHKAIIVYSLCCFLKVIMSFFVLWFIILFSHSMRTCYYKKIDNSQLRNCHNWWQKTLSWQFHKNCRKNGGKNSLSRQFLKNRQERSCTNNIFNVYDLSWWFFKNSHKMSTTFLGGSCKITEKGYMC